MNKKIELLAPGGDVDCIKAAIIAGADAVYCGLDKFNARNRAANISFDELQGLLRLAHAHGCQIFLTVNIIILETEIPELISVLNRLVNTTIDGIIIQDFGLFYLLMHHFPSLPIHASTQLTTHNEGQIQFLHQLRATRVNLMRELDIRQISHLTEAAHRDNVLIEVFVHGSYCIGVSGLCYLSSVLGGRSGNRGRCSQPCRDQCVTTAKGKDFPLNLKDNSAYLDLQDLADAGVDSLKIEGRIKKFHYVHTIVGAWRRQLERMYRHQPLDTDTSVLYSVFNRDFSNGFLRGCVGAEMFIDNPRDNSAIHLSETNGGAFDGNIELAKADVFDRRTEIITTVEREISQLDAAKAPVTIAASGTSGSPLQLQVQTPDQTFTIVSACPLASTGTEALSEQMLSARLKQVNDTEYFIERIDVRGLTPEVYLPFKELTAIKKRLLFVLNGNKEPIAPVSLPALAKNRTESLQPALSVLISSPDDLHLCRSSSASFYYQLPNAMNGACDGLVQLFAHNRQLIPWFPSLLIGDDYIAAVRFLHQIRPARIVTDNTGIAFAASRTGIAWIAGPQLNLVNSYSLLCLQEQFNCSGAFISNEINRMQIKAIKRPAGFELHYRIYHPIELMTSLQCLFHQVTGCAKHTMDGSCIAQCEKRATVTNLKDESFVVEKSKGNFHHLYNESNFLNTDILADIPGMFTGFAIDLRRIPTGTVTPSDPLSIITHFEQLLSGNADSAQALRQMLHPTTCEQYMTGI